MLVDLGQSQQTKQTTVNLIKLDVDRIIKSFCQNVVYRNLSPCKLDLRNKVFQQKDLHGFFSGMSMGVGISNQDKTAISTDSGWSASLAAECLTRSTSY